MRINASVERRPWYECSGRCGRHCLHSWDGRYCWNRRNSRHCREVLAEVVDRVAVRWSVLWNDGDVLIRRHCWKRWYRCWDSGRWKGERNSGYGWIGRIQIAGLWVVGWGEVGGIGGSIVRGVVVGSRVIQTGWDAGDAGGTEEGCPGEEEMWLKRKREDQVGKSLWWSRVYQLSNYK